MSVDAVLDYGWVGLELELRVRGFYSRLALVQDSNRDGS